MNAPDRDGDAGGSSPEKLLILSQSLDFSDPSVDPWEELRDWMNASSSNTLREALLIQGSQNETALHIICRNEGPYDLVERIVSAAPASVPMIDLQGRTALHYSAVNGEDRVLQILSDCYPLATQIGDFEGLVPLHFALRSRGAYISNVCAKILSTGHANSIKDAAVGMLPL